MGKGAGPVWASASPSLRRGRGDSLEGVVTAIVILYVACMGVWDYLRGREIHIIYTLAFSLDGACSPSGSRVVDRVAEHPRHKGGER